MGTKLDNLIKNKKITMQLLPSIYAPEMASAINHYTIVLRYNHRHFTLPQADRKKNIPSIQTVLSALIEDAVTYTDTGSYEKWCEVSGCEPEEEVARREYQQLGWYANGLRRFLGDKIYEETISTWRRVHAPLEFTPAV